MKKPLSSIQEHEEPEVIHPRPQSLIQSLRAVGYSLPAAVADIIDNSITAGARHVWIRPEWSGAGSCLTITDDGRGMDRSTLVEAMRLGTRSPSETRDLRDLGRFGLGLKTASFSQCKSLTVFSKTAHEHPVVRRWDLDHVCRVEAWELLASPRPGSEHFLKLSQGSKSGTMVLWECLDRVLPADADPLDEKLHKHFLQTMEEVSHHLAMVFHRILGSNFQIHVHHQDISPWDPFMSRHDATQRFPVEYLGVGKTRVRVEGYVLPHVSRLTVQEHKLGAGVGGWNERQGFYIYRNDRLLVPGDWLDRSLKKEEHVKLARIAIDLPNSLDAEWNLDIKKSTARPPAKSRKDLRRIADIVRRAATEVYRHRGKVLARTNAQTEELLWTKVVKGQKYHYLLNRRHPLVQRVFEAATDRPAMDALLRLIEETVPVPMILCDGYEQPENQSRPFEHVPEKEIFSIAVALLGVLAKDGLSARSAAERLSAMEPFPYFPHIVSAAVESLEKE